MRFAYGINAKQGDHTPPTVQYWRGRNGEVDFVFEVDETPVPVGLAYRSRDREAPLAAVHEFKDEYHAPLGLLLAGDTVREDQPVQQIEDGVIQLPYWLYLLLC
jgi:predicted AAA+ superfamily ATPase